MNKDDKKFLNALVVSLVIAFIIFLMLPNYMTRNPLSYGAILPIAYAVLAVIDFFDRLLNK